MRSFRPSATAFAVAFAVAFAGRSVGSDVPTVAAPSTADPATPPPPSSTPPATLRPTTGPPPPATSPPTARPRRTGVVALPSGRTYTVGVDQPSLPDAPTVVVLHGFYGTIASVRTQTRLDDVGRAERWNVVYGQGRNSSWNAGGCCGRAAANGTDDVGYLREIAAHLRARGARGPVYLAGFSNGGMLALRAACEHPGTFVRVASIGGPLLAPCKGRIVARHLHGRNDTVVPYRGGRSEFTKTTFPDSTTERQRVPRGSDYELVTYEGGHGLPKRATAYLREFFATGSSDVVV